MCAVRTENGAAVDGGLSEGTSLGQHLAGPEPALDDLGERGARWSGRSLVAVSEARGPGGKGFASVLLSDGCWGALAGEGYSRVSICRKGALSPAVTANTYLYICVLGYCLSPPRSVDP